MMCVLAVNVLASSGSIESFVGTNQRHCACVLLAGIGVMSSSPWSYIGGMIETPGIRVAIIFFAVADSANVERCISHTVHGKWNYGRGYYVVEGPVVGSDGRYG